MRSSTWLGPADRFPKWSGARRASTGAGRGLCVGRSGPAHGVLHVRSSGLDSDAFLGFLLSLAERPGRTMRAGRGRGRECRFEDAYQFAGRVRHPQRPVFCHRCAPGRSCCSTDCGWRSIARAAGRFGFAGQNQMRGPAAHLHLHHVAAGHVRCGRKLGRGAPRRPRRRRSAEGARAT